ncbi:MAG: PepSY domain-containing protein [Hyphomicrobiaceae bacterium]
MRTLLTLATIAITGLAGAAYAGDQAKDNTKASRTISAEQMKAGMEQLGYDVQRMERDDGAYELYLVDRDSGGKVKAHFDITTGEMTRAKLAHVDRKTGEHEERDEDRD